MNTNDSSPASLAAAHGSAARNAFDAMRGPAPKSDYDAEMVTACWNAAGDCSWPVWQAAVEWANKHSEVVKVMRQALCWPTGEFRIHDMPGEHDPCYLVCPDGLMIPFNAHATNGVDQARAQWFADTLNAALNAPGELPCALAERKG
jgi:hypothetical protein